eukprot:gb/GFBE01080368.1/.p1 GENE.gb/GFBE01080368.1/~~gb/GFBE01080368.1/.p1  ORF type:complete len:514 (+),score=88.24 gb/GFBE01080368.1/:1-1542(+)
MPSPTIKQHDLPSLLLTVQTNIPEPDPPKTSVSPCAGEREHGWPESFALGRQEAGASPAPEGPEDGGGAMHADISNGSGLEPPVESDVQKMPTPPTESAVERTSSQESWVPSIRNTRRSRRVSITEETVMQLNQAALDILEQETGHAVSMAAALFATFTWSTGVAAAGFAGVLTQLWAEDMKAGTVSVMLSMVWAYLGRLTFSAVMVMFQKGMQTCSTNPTRRSLQINLLDATNHMVCGCLASLDSCFYMSAINHAGVLFSQVTRLAGSAMGTVLFLRLFTGKTISTQQGLYLVPLLSISVAFALQTSSSDSGAGHNLGLASMYVALSVFCNAVMTAYMEVATKSRGDDCLDMAFSCRQTADSVGALSAILAARFIDTAASGDSMANALELPNWKGVLLAGCVAWWTGIAPVTVSLTGAGILSLAKPATLVLVYTCSVLVLGAPFRVSDALSGLCILWLTIVYMVEPIQRRRRESKLVEETVEEFRRRTVDSLEQRRSERMSRRPSLVGYDCL